MWVSPAALAAPGESPRRERSDRRAWTVLLGEVPFLVLYGFGRAMDGEDDHF